MTFGSIQIPAFLAKNVYNLYSDRFCAAPLDTREEGWTEAWGSKEVQDSSSSKHWQYDEKSIELMLATPYPQIPLVLTQFRPAFLEQLALRIAGIPHIVLNAPYISNEATGPLPYLRDLNADSPALVGRHHPSNIAPFKSKGYNSILDYLKSSKSLNLDSALQTDSQKVMSQCLLHLIDSELQQILLFLRYEDHDAWEQVYRGRYLQASRQRHSWISDLKGRFQAMLERAAARRKGLEFYQTLSVKRAIDIAKEAYGTLEKQLASHSKPYLLGTDKPCMVDIVLWAHLSEALCDIHLVVVLSSFPKLVEFFQRMYKTYFTGKLGAWDAWNVEQNLTNAFQQIPINGAATGNNKSIADMGAYKDAIELMQSLSMQKQDLQEVLDAVKAKRSEDVVPEPSAPTESMLYRWRMGEEPSKFAEEEKEEEPHPNRKTMIREQQRNDEIWMSGVAGVSILVVLALQSTSEVAKAK
ncbi:unnamed protein product [Cylindrotheca closterium]|uniref:GST C-terminal domain-containing protein n=1 Tax=Cylindrotheca closterium TaxID=2856 RepID=A0AAD2G329_9STRA|nr:unnamed protein product [Cylindrotheca closterium]